MNRNLTFTLVNLLFGIAGGSAEAGDAVIRGDTNGARRAVVERALDACASAVVARLFPGQQRTTTHVLAADDRSALEAAGHNEMIVTLTAAAKGAAGPLAVAECTVTYTARVVNLSVRVSDKEQIARLSAGDLQLSLARR
jgi:hypothetical protein